MMSYLEKVKEERRTTTFSPRITFNYLFPVILIFFVGVCDGCDKIKTLPQDPPTRAPSKEFRVFVKLILQNSKNRELKNQGGVVASDSTTITNLSAPPPPTVRKFESAVTLDALIPQERTITTTAITEPPPASSLLPSSSLTPSALQSSQSSSPTAAVISTKQFTFTQRPVLPEAISSEQTDKDFLIVVLDETTSEEHQLWISSDDSKCISSKSSSPSTSSSSMLLITAVKVPANKAVYIFDNPTCNGPPHSFLAGNATETTTFHLENSGLYSKDLWEFSFKKFKFSKYFQPNIKDLPMMQSRFSFYSGLGVKEEVELEKNPLRCFSLDANKISIPGSESQFFRVCNGDCISVFQGKNCTGEKVLLRSPTSTTPSKSCIEVPNTSQNFNSLSSCPKEKENMLPKSK